jgi:transcriptional accessory protein Tex/SPT6
MLTVTAAPKKKKKTEDGKSMDIDIPASNKKPDDVYETYYNFSKPVPTLRPYQTLAINRGEKEGTGTINTNNDSEIYL